MCEQKPQGPQRDTDGGRRKRDREREESDGGTVRMEWRREKKADSVFASSLTSMSRGRRVILCMGRMRKEIMGRFLQSGWASILVSTSLNEEFLELREKLDSAP